MKDVKVDPVDPIVIDVAERVKINRHISRYLKEYQVEGAMFMYDAYKSNMGCILAGEKIVSNVPLGRGAQFQVCFFQMRWVWEKLSR